MSLHRGLDGSEPTRPEPIGRVAEPRDLRRDARAGVMATGTLACPTCDAPVAPAGRTLVPAQPLACPFCDHAGPVRDFLSLAGAARPARVEVRVVRAYRSR